MNAPIPQTTEVWLPMATAPKDGTQIDCLFDVATAEIDGDGKNMAEFYAPGSTRRRNPAEPIIRGVKFARGHFRPCSGGIEFYAIVSVDLTHWRPGRGTY